MAAVFAFDDYVLDTSLYELRLRGDRCPLARKPLDVLEHLILNRHRVVLKDELRERLWPGVHVTDNALVQAIVLVREALVHTPAPAVASVRGRGYRFVRPVTPRTADLDASTQAWVAALPDRSVAALARFAEDELQLRSLRNPRSA